MGDLAVTRGAVALIRAAGGGDELTVVAPPLKPGQRAGWRGTATRASGLSLREWDPSLPTLRGEQAPSVELFDDLLDSPRLRAALREAAGVAGARHVYYGGGEHLFARGDPGEDWSIAGRLLPLLAAHRDGARVLCLPTTFGPLETPLARELVSRLGGAASVLLARDAGSLRELTGLGLEAEAGADPAFFLPVTERARPLFRRSPMRVALVMRLESTGLRAGAARSRTALARLRRDGFGNSSAYRAFLALGRGLLAAGHEIRVLVQSDSDREPARALVAELDAGERVQLMQPRGLPQYVRALSFCPAVVTARFHSAIFGLLTGAVPIGMHFAGHGPKLPGLLELLGAPELLVGADDDGGHEAALEALERERAERPGLGAELADRAEALRASTLSRVAAGLG